MDYRKSSSSRPDVSRALIGREELFRKRFEFPQDVFGQVTADQIFSSPTFVDEFLQESKTKLNTTKSKLDCKNLLSWKSLTKFTNQTGSVVSKVRDQFRAEMCTNAWVKMIEMLSTQNVFPAVRSEVEHIGSVHICEAPGAFIAATNHYIRMYRGSNVKWSWTGLSLNPYYEGNDLGAMIDDDAFILNSLNHWCFGHDNSGNIMSRENIEDLWSSVRNNPVHLVTGDGSIDCSDSPNEQESVVAPLHFAEAVAMLGMLNLGGTAVLKLFTLFEHESICLVYLLGSLFERTVVNKPATSTQGNSEVYLILYGYKGCPASLLEKLLQFVSPSHPPKALVPHDLMSPEYLLAIRKCGALFADWQRSILERNLALDERKSKEEEWAIKSCRNEVVSEFVRLCDLRHISDRLRIVTSVQLTGAYNQLNTGEAVGSSFGKQRDRREGDLQSRQHKKEERDAYLRGDLTPSGVKRPHEDDNISNGFYGPNARNLMEKSGGKNLQGGLGRDEQGRIEPIEAVPLPRFAGLNESLPALLAFDTILSSSVPSVPGEPLFQSDGLDVSQSWLVNPFIEVSAKRSVQELKESGWKVTVASRLPAVILSKFCREKAIRKLYEVRETVLPELIARRLENGILPSECEFFATGPALAQRLSLSLVASQLAHVDALFGWLTGKSSLQFFDFSRQHVSPMAEYLESKSPKVSWSGFGFSESKFVGYSQFENYDVSLVNFTTLRKKVQSIPKAGICFLDSSSNAASHIGNRNTEAQSKFFLFGDSLLSLDILATDGWLVLKVGDVFSRATVGLLYVFYNVFQFVQLIKPFSCPSWTNEKFLVCRGFRSDCDGFREHLTNVFTSLLEQPDLDVLAIAPMEELLNPSFFRHILLSNERYAHREVCSLLKLQWAISNQPNSEYLNEIDTELERVVSILSGVIPVDVSTTVVDEVRPLKFNRFVTASQATDTSKGNFAISTKIQDTAPEQPIPLGWTQQWSSTHKRPYYYHAGSGKTTWVIPK